MKNEKSNDARHTTTVKPGRIGKDTQIAYGASIASWVLDFFVLFYQEKRTKKKRIPHLKSHEN